MALGDDFTKYSGIFNGQPCICKKKSIILFLTYNLCILGGTL